MTDIKQKQLNDFLENEFKKIKRKLLPKTNQNSLANIKIYNSWVIVMKANTKTYIETISDNADEIENLSSYASVFYEKNRFSLIEDE
ncbi:hypothetical protein [Bernardetia sp. MNP-M8]|uniref:hypothetical protein n=1 Tax=Bernardetia sp. MNP-M8 TaxID=3127470 RepID=UPI0030CAE7C4